MNVKNIIELHEIMYSIFEISTMSNTYQKQTF